MTRLLNAIGKAQPFGLRLFVGIVFVCFICLMYIMFGVRLDGKVRGSMLVFAVILTPLLWLVITICVAIVRVLSVLSVGSVVSVFAAATLGACGCV